MIILKRILLTLVLLFAISPTCFASSWYWIGADSTGAQYYIDNASVQKDFYTATVWIKKDVSDGTYNLSEFVFNHMNKKCSLQASISYDATGNVIENNSWSYKDYQSIPPDSALEAAYYSIWPN